MMDFNSYMAITGRKAFAARVAGATPDTVAEIERQPNHSYHALKNLNGKKALSWKPSPKTAHHPFAHPHLILVPSPTIQ